MEIRVLGAHKLESRHTKHTCFLIDGVLGLEAGSLTSVLTPEEQAQIRAVLLTHSHFDHIRDLPTLGLATLDDPRPIDLYGLQETLDAIQEHLLNGVIYPDLTKPLSGRPPKFRLCALEPAQVTEVLGYQVKPVTMPHPVPCIGYSIESPGGFCMAYTGDTRGNLLPFFEDSIRPDIMFMDVSFPNRTAELAELTGHLSPQGLRQELLLVQARGLKLPRLVAVHLNPADREELISELGPVAAELGVDLSAGQDGMRISAQEPR